MATAEFNKVKDPRQEFTLSSDQYDLDQDVEVGDWVAVFDSERGIVDLTHPLTYRGQVIFPEYIRCVGHSWPVRAGMGVYLRHFVDNNTATWPVEWEDLTEYIVPEDGATTVEVGAKPRPS